MTELVRPRLTDHYGIAARQGDLSFAIPFLHEDIPLYVDPFLLWRSPSQQDQSLHEALINAFNRVGLSGRGAGHGEALQAMIAASECDEVGLGNSRTRQGKRIGESQAENILSLFERLPRYAKGECAHIEELQLLVDGISKDRISDLTCNFLKSFLIDYTMDEAERLGVPVEDTKVDGVYSSRDRRFTNGVAAKLPINPATGKPLLFVPKRWLRFVPWINFEDYFRTACPQDDIAHEGEALERVQVLTFNRDNYGTVEEYVAAKERSFADASNDPLFEQIPVVSAKRHLKKLQRLATGNEKGEDKEYEQLLELLLPSLLYPHLDFAKAQSRTDSNVSIRDLVFYNNESDPFLKELNEAYGSRQIPFEMKNVAEVAREHLDQLNRYLAPDLGRFGVLVTRSELKRARQKQAVDLWSGQRKAIVTLTDEDVAQMVELFDTKQRNPIDVLKKKHFEFKQRCPV